MSDHRIWLPYTQLQTAPAPLRAARTEGSRIVLADGRTLIDGIASWWTACHGYNHPVIRAAVERQLAAMPHVMLGGLVHEPAIVLADRLAERLPGSLSHTFFSESGSVAVEVAMKMALQFWMNRGQPARRRFLSFNGGYHGDTFAAMSVCDPEEGMHALFAGALAEQLIVELPRDSAGLAALDTLLAAEAGQLAGMIVEPLVQAAGGMRFHTASMLAAVVDTARRHGLLVIFDEIATGFGRTGTLFAMEQVGRVPDIVTLSKALTGGTLPLAATVASEDVFAAFLDDDPNKALMHGPTFAGNPLGCAAANASLDLFDSEPRVVRAAGMEARLAAGLSPCAALPGVVDVRARGAIGVVQLTPPVDTTALRERLIDRGVWVRPFGDIVYLTPALTITDSELDRLIVAVNEVVHEWSRV